MLFCVVLLYVFMCCLVFNLLSLSKCAEFIIFFFQSKQVLKAQGILKLAEKNVNKFELRVSDYHRQLEVQDRFCAEKRKDLNEVCAM
jgi:hypothetical protein